MSRRVLWVVLILLLIVVFVWFRGSILDLFNGQNNAVVEELDEELDEEPLSDLEEPLFSPVQELIEEARMLGDEENQYQSALGVLDRAKNYVNPFPTEEESITIAELTKRYTEALTPTSPAVLQSKILPVPKPRVSRRIRKRTRSKPIQPEPFIEEKIEEEMIEEEEEELEETLDIPPIFEELEQTEEPETPFQMETEEEESIFEEELEEDLGSLANELYRKGREALNEKEYESAISFFDQSLDYNPDHVLAHSYKATSHYKLDDVDKAISSADEALLRQMDEPNAHFVKGEIFYDDYRDEEAENEYSQVIRKDTENGLAYFKLGVLSLMADKNEDAEGLFSRALDLEETLETPYVLFSYYDRGIARERLENWEDSSEDYRGALDLDPNYERAYIQLGRVLYKTKDYDGAIEVLRQGKNRFPESLPIAFLEAKSLDAQYDSDPEEKNTDSLDKALQGYESVLELDEDHVESWYNSARLEYKKGNYTQALEDLERASEIEKDYLIELLYGNVYFALEDYERSREHYQAALDMGPSRIGVYQGLGAIDIAQARSSRSETPERLEHWNNARENLERAVEKRSNFELNQALGIVYYHLEDYDRSIDFFQKALLEKEENSNTHMNLAELYFATENYSSAVTHYERAVEFYSESSKESKSEELIKGSMEGPMEGSSQKPKLYYLYRRLGQSYLELSNKKEALIWLERLVNEFPESLKERQVRIYLRVAKND